MSQQGWVRIHRKIKECWIYDDKPFDRTHAWIDLLLRANHQGKKIMLGNELIDVKRGSFITSELKLMESFGWSKTKLRSFLKMLKDDGMIEIIADKKKTTVNIVNYSIYQDTENHEETIKEPQEDHKETIKEPRKDTNKNDKECSNNVKEDLMPKKIKYADRVSMTEDEYNKITTQYPKDVIDNKIIDLDLWKGGNGKKTKSDYLTLLTWLRKDKPVIQLKEVAEGWNHLKNFDER